MIRQTCIAIVLVFAGIDIAAALILVSYLFSEIRKDMKEIKQKEKNHAKRSSGKK